MVVLSADSRCLIETLMGWFLKQSCFGNQRSEQLHLAAEGPRFACLKTNLISWACASCPSWHMWRGDKGSRQSQHVHVSKPPSRRTCKRLMCLRSIHWGLQVSEISNGTGQLWQWEWEVTIMARQATSSIFIGRPPCLMLCQNLAACAPSRLSEELS